MTWSTRVSAVQHSEAGQVEPDELLELETDSGAKPYLLQDLLQRPELLVPPPIVLPRIAWQGRVTMLAAGEKIGKSTMMGQAAAAVCRGVEFLGEPVPMRDVMWLALDEHLGDVVRRLSDHGATNGVVVWDQRPTWEQMEQAMEEHHPVGLVVVDTLTEFAQGHVEDSNAPEEWTPILGNFRRLAQRTGCAVVLLHHSNRATGKYRGSGQLGAGVDVILEMTEPDSDATVRKVRAKGRVPVSDFTVRYSGGRYELDSGEVSLQMRVYRVIEANPGISKRALRAEVGGKATEVDAALGSLLSTVVENRGDGSGGKYHARPLKVAEGPGHAWDTPRDTGGVSELSDAGQSGTRLRHTSGHPPVSHPLREGVGTQYQEGLPCPTCKTPTRRTVHRVFRCPTCTPDNRWAA
jgi:hypothetical protein